MNEHRNNEYFEKILQKYSKSTFLKDTYENH